MAEKKKEGLFNRLFGGKNKGCCDVKIEEIKDEANKEKADPSFSSEESRTENKP